ncbi:MAG: DUF4111 domain-containing protein [Erysipelotrichaceae bacterium]|nr:DUF4111 domain-containing protein [Erysipelotrichaceae bacterium]
MPFSLDSFIEDYVNETREILKDNLVGIYLHGSAVMGCFNPLKSDVDMIIVINRPLTAAVKREYMDMVVRHNDLGPAKGIEMSIVLRKVCKPFVYPTPYELHFSVGHLQWYQEDPEEYIREMNGEDKDLAAHFTIINHRGRCLYGAPIEEVFAEVPAADYMDSIWFDIEEAEEAITEYPMYLTLNLARVLAYKQDGLILSKKEGGQWAVKNLPSEYHPLISAALHEYEEGTEVIYDPALARRYARYVIRRIRQ